ncbi:hypothetical protein N8I77_001054 [Diaporthe amygdali]|uniref:Uncharacterized protein n=1 Tax=Phomopsis amygdali TaxID=1214568 RepID=A0AAD9W922_PHOAM|nr:hypothetical protein N8I77_001054 [Diaporthe amygdali]
MNNHDIFDEPPPSYEEATGRPSNNSNTNHQGPPPPTPPRPANNKANGTQNTPNTPGGPASPTVTPHTPAQTFQQILPVSQTVNQQFPPAFNLYRDAFPGQRSYFLGEHQVTPLYSVTAWTGWTTGASLVLHNGPSDDHPPLATVVYESLGRRMSVNLPPLPGHRPEPISVAMPTFMSAKFTFVVEVKNGMTYRKEAFEWRRSNSLAISGLGGRSQGWKLVRLSNELPPGGVTIAGSGPPSGDGHEVVAVCTDAVMSLTKMFKFSFLGTGLSGALGERWAVMAVATGLVIWDQERRRD